MDRGNLLFLSAEAVVAFTATLSGVLLAFTIEKWDTNAEKDRIIDTKLEYAVDECLNLNNDLLNLEDQWRKRFADFVDNPKINLDLINVFDFPVLLLDRFGYDFEFMSRLDKRTYEMMLAHSRTVSGGLGNLNALASQMRNFAEFGAAADPVMALNVINLMRDNAHEFKDSIPAVRSDVFFACFALAIDECRDSRSSKPFSAFHKAWTNGQNITVNSDLMKMNCRSIWELVEIEPLESDSS